MPRLPTVDGTSVALNAAPNAYQETPSMLGGAAMQRAQQMGAIGQAVGQYAEHLQAEQDQARFDDARNQLLQAETSLTFGDAGYTRQRGAAALQRDSGQPLADEYAGKLRQSVSEIEAGLGNDRQRRAFRTFASNTLATFTRKATAFEGQQAQEYQQSVNEGTITLAQQRMGLQWTDIQAISDSRAAVIGAVAKQSAAAGLSPEETQARTVQALSPGHAAVLTSAIDAGNLEFAKVYMERAGAELLPAARLQLQKALDIGTADAREQSITDGLWSKHGGNVEAAISEARQTLKGKDEDAVVQRLKMRDTERETFKNRAERTAYEGGLLALAQGRPVSPSTLAAMGEGHAAAILEHQRAKAKAAAAEAAGKPVKTDWTLYLTLREQAVEDPEAFGKLDLTRYVDKIGGAQLEQLADIKRSMAQAASRPAKAGREAITLTQQMNATIGALKITSKVQRGQFMGFVQGEVDDATTAKGKPLTYDERQQIIDRAVLQGPDPDAWLWGTKRMFELTPEQRGRFKPNAPAAVAPARVTNDAEYRALPPGTRFITPDGKTGTKS